MGMKRFSAPPALYPASSSPHSLPTSKASDASANNQSGPSAGSQGPATTPSLAGLHPQFQDCRPHDSASKRVKTEQTFESLFDKETHSDVTINVNGDEGVFHAHRMVLELKSDVIAAMLAKLSHKPDIQLTVGGARVAVPVLHVQEDPECSQVFSRFLYFLYSGAVWLHQEYVLPLFRLAHKYGVQSLKQHCHTYILQVLAKSCHASPPASHSHSHCHNQNNNNNNNTAHNHSPSSSGSSSSTLLTSPNANSPPYTGSGFSLVVVCDLYEEQVYEGDIRQTAFRLLCCQFRQLVRTERWLRFGVQAVCSFIASDSCSVEENLILVSATDYMKRNNLADKKQIEEILSLIRYPRLNRRVLYHLQKNGSFKNFPHIQELMLNAMKFHCFKDLPEAKDDFVGWQFRPRMTTNSGSPNRRASTHVASVTDNQSEATVFAESAYSLDPSSPMTLTPSRHSQV